MNILLDTSAIYALSDIRPSVLDRQAVWKLGFNHNIYVSSVSIAECVLGNQYNLEDIKRILYPLVGIVSHYISGGYIELSADELPRILKAKSIGEIGPLIQRWKKNKLKCESEYARLFIYLILFPLFQQKAERLVDKNPAKAGLFFQQTMAFFEAQLPLYYSSIYDALESQYDQKDGKPQKMAKEEFLFNLQTANQMSDWMLRAAMENTNFLDEDLSEEQEAKIFSTEGHATEIKIKKSLAKEVLYTNFQQIMDQPGKFTRGDPYTQGYLLRLADKMLTKGGTLKINDISDLLVINALKMLPTPAAMLTDDGAMKSYLTDIGMAFQL